MQRVSSIFSSPSGQACRQLFLSDLQQLSRQVLPPCSAISTYMLVEMQTGITLHSSTPARMTFLAFPLGVRILITQLRVTTNTSLPQSFISWNFTFPASRKSSQSPIFPQIILPLFKSTNRRSFWIKHFSAFELSSQLNTCFCSYLMVDIVMPTSFCPKFSTATGGVPLKIQKSCILKGNSFKENVSNGRCSLPGSLYMLKRSDLAEMSSAVIHVDFST